MNANAVARVLVGLVLVLSIGLPRRGGAQESPLLGQWALSADESDDVERAIRGGTREVARVRGRSDPLDRVSTALLKYLQRDASHLELLRADATTTVISGDGTVLVYGTDTPRTAVFTDGVEVQAKAEWRDAELRLEARAPGGGILEERYALDGDTGSLEVDVRLRWPDRGLNIRYRRTYHRIPVAPYRPN